MKSNLRTSHFCFLGLFYVNNCILNVLKNLKYVHTEYHFEIWWEKGNVHEECLGFFGFVNKRQFCGEDLWSLPISSFLSQFNSVKVGNAMAILIFSSWSQSSFGSYNDPREVARHVTAVSVLSMRKTNPSPNH